MDASVVGGEGTVRQEPCMGLGGASKREAC